MIRVHALKTVQPYYDAVASGMKTFEIRTFDRPFEVGDQLLLREYVDGEYTGRAEQVVVTYVMTDSEFVMPGTVVLGIRPPTLGQHLTMEEAIRRAEDELKAMRP